LSFAALRLCAPVAEGEKTVAVNRKAGFDYEFLERYEAGLELTGTEIKSIREGKVNIRDAYARIQNGEMWLHNLHIAEYPAASHFNHEPTRPRRLLLHKDEIAHLAGALEQRGLTLIATRLYLKRGRAKIELAVGRGRKSYDKRAVIAERDANRAIQRAIRQR
jgi:SsrA-binding protein